MLAASKLGFGFINCKQTFTELLFLKCDTFFRQTGKCATTKYREFQRTLGDAIFGSEQTFF